MSVSSSAPSKAVMLRGPSLTSKTYFVPLPETLEQLIAKATDLFSLPPGKVPHITLGSDERAIILQESFDFIRDRELLHFRWTGDTTKRNLSNRVRWDEAAATSSATEVLKATLQSSPTQSQQLMSSTKANTIANRDPSTQFGEGMAARKAHAQRVLSEHKRKNEEQHMADALGSNPDVYTAEQGPLPTEVTSPLLAPQESQPEPAEPEQPTVSVHKELQPVTASTLTIESPPRKKRAEHVDLDTPPSSGSRSSGSPYLTGERAVLSNGALRPEDDQSSSPLQSPTRDVSRHRGAEDVCTALGASVELQKVTEQLENTIDIVTTPVDDLTGDTASSDASAAHNAPEIVTAPASVQPSATVHENKDVDKVYSFLTNLVSQLLSHRSNWFFQRPLSAEFEQFSARCSRPIDLFTMRDSLAARKYGSALLTGRVAANAVLTEFQDDLSLFYSNARKFFGVRSTQAECVEHLEKFSRSFVNEWKRAHSVRVDSGVHRGGFFSPSPRSAVTSKASDHVSGSANGSVAVKKSASTNGTPANAQLQRSKPDFLYKRNASYDGHGVSSAPGPTLATSAGGKRTPFQPLTSEAFERALRAPTSTPQPDRIRPRQDVVAPFITRSVIEPVPASQAPQQVKPPLAEIDNNMGPLSSEPPVIATPTRKRRLELDEEETPPPNSPSPIKRMVAAVLPSLASLKAATGKTNKNGNKTKTPKAAAPVATNQEAADQQSVLDLITSNMSHPEPVRKRAKKATSSKAKGGVAASVSSPVAVDKPAPKKLKSGKTPKMAKKNKSSTAAANAKAKATEKSAVGKSRPTVVIETRAPSKAQKAASASRALRSKNGSPAKGAKEARSNTLIEPQHGHPLDQNLQRRSSRPRKPTRVE